MLKLIYVCIVCGSGARKSFLRLFEDLALSTKTANAYAIVIAILLFEHDQHHLSIEYTDVMIVTALKIAKSGRPRQALQRNSFSISQTSCFTNMCTQLSCEKAKSKINSYIP